MPRFIGVHGKAKSGKDELCDILCKTYGFTKIAFATEIKELAIKHFGVTTKELYIKKNKHSRQIMQGIGEFFRDLDMYLPIIEANPTGEIWPKTIGSKLFNIKPEDVERKLKYNKQVFQGLKNIFEACYVPYMTLFLKGGFTQPSSWKDVWISILFNKNQEDKVYVVSDIRYQNEKQSILNVEGKVIKLVRTDLPPIEAGATHASEIELDNDTDWFDTIINAHKAKWRDGLAFDAANIVRRLVFEKFFTVEDIEKFKVNL